MLAILNLIVEIFLLWLKDFAQKDQEKKEQSKDLRQAGKNALAEKNPDVKASRINAVLNDIRIMHEDG